MSSDINSPFIDPMYIEVETAKIINMEKRLERIRSMISFITGIYSINLLIKKRMDLWMSRIKTIKDYHNCTQHSIAFLKKQRPADKYMGSKY